MDRDVQPSELSLIFRANLKNRRKELGLSQHELAEALGVTQPCVAQLENGRRLPQLDTLARYAEALATTPDALLTPGIFSPASN